MFHQFFRSTVIFDNDTILTIFVHHQVAKPLIGENHPAQVRADVTVNLSVREHVKNEWQGRCQHAWLPWLHKFC